MSIALETEVVASAFDPIGQTHTYTIARNGKQWTVCIPAQQLDLHGANAAARRKHLTLILEGAMRGLADGEKGPP